MPAYFNQQGEVEAHLLNKAMLAELERLQAELSQRTDELERARELLGARTSELAWARADLASAV